MIESGRNEEAVAHCQAILRAYPMHVDTYRLLGKAFLEVHSYADATDIFQRVLMAVPDDFVAHVGMSIIRDDGEKLDEAIWHMERAFEIQPSNPAIQGELRRLYGRRDGVEPPKIRLSRDALANMYAQGGLFSQAMAEIRAILADDPDRPDLQVMLGRVYYQSGQKMEAAEVASGVLKKYPHCVDALRILVEVLPESAGGEGTQAYRQRLRSLDPYSAFATGSVFDTDKVPDTSVSVERLEYQAGAMSAALQPGWTPALGSLPRPSQDASEPGWPKDAKPAPVPAFFPESSAQAAEAPGPQPGASQPPAAQTEAGIPEFLRSAGWSESSGTVAENSPASEEVPPATPVAAVDIPDWIRSMAPPEVQQAPLPAGSQTPSQAAGGLPEWLKGIDGSAAPGEAVPAAAWEPAGNEGEAGGSAAGLPGWIKGEQEGAEFVPGGTAPNPAETVEPADASTAGSAAGQPTVPEGELPDWLQRTAQAGRAEPVPAAQLPVEPGAVPAPGPAAGPSGAEAEGLPQWLQGIPSSGETAGVEEAAAEAQAQALPAGNGSPTPSGSQEYAPSLPDWLAGKPPAPLSSEPQTPAAPAAGPAGGTPESAPMDQDTLAWLEELAAKQGPLPGELQNQPQERLDELPAWLRNEPEQANAPITQPVAAEAESPIQPGEAVQEAPAPVPPVVQEQAAPTASVEPVAVPETGPASSPVGAEDQGLGWLEGLGAGIGVEPAGPSGNDQVQAEAAAAEPPPAGKPGEAAPSAEPSQEELDMSLTGWFKKLDASRGNSAEASTEASSETASDADSRELPAWLKELEKPVQTPTDQAAAKPKVDLPDWLTGTSQASAPLGRPEPAGIEPEPPSWSTEEALPGSSAPTPTIPQEWQPVDTFDSEVSPEAAPASVPEPAAAAPAALVPPPTAGQPAPAGVTVPAAQDPDAESLARARTSLSANQPAGALQIYVKLVKRGRMLEEVIHDLREAIYRYPVDPLIWQTLGDAYMRANRLQDALDAYTKAEELLR
jgi:tetratricopeptide (TPR) repeat protein